MWWLCSVAVQTQLELSRLCLWQVWKRSGAWFYKGLPKYITPLKSSSGSKPLELQAQPWQGEAAVPEPESVGSSRSFTWARGKGWLSHPGSRWEKELASPAAGRIPVIREVLCWRCYPSRCGVFLMWVLEFRLWCVF